MDPRANLISLAGNWQGTYTLQDPETNRPEESASTLTWIPILGDRFIRVEYTWLYQGTAQEGLFLIGYEPDTQVFTLHWIDTWHMGDRVMTCRGGTDDKGAVAVLGSYSIPDNPDWGWQIVIVPDTDRSLRIAMKNITPDGQEFPAVESAYSKI